MVIRTTPGGISYELTRKRVKNLNLRVHPDGRIAVSIPMRVSFGQADAFVDLKKEWLEAVFCRLAAREATPENTLLLFGRRIPYDVRIGPAAVSAQRGRLMVSAPSAAEAERVAKQWRAKRIETVMPRALQLAETRFSGFALPPYTVRYRRMTSRWGSCQREKKVLAFSDLLMCAPFEAIEYVAAHELAHFFAAGHGPDFYEVMGNVMPDHRRRRALLKKINLQKEG